MEKYFLIGVLCFATSCDLVVDVDVPVEKPRLTLNSVFIQDSLWKAKLTLNRHILDETYFPTVDDGQIVIYHESNPVDTLNNEGNGHYSSDSRPVPGGSYEIRASSPAHGSVRSLSYLPEPVPIDDVEIEVVENPSFDRPAAFIKFQFKDRAEESNYYQILLFAETTYTDQLGQKYTRFYPVPLQSNDPVITEQNGDSDEGLFFKDTLFEGQEISLSMKSPFHGTGFDDLKLVFFLRTLSEDFYRYKITSLLQNRIMGDPLAQPVTVYSNIEDGYGIFGGFSQSLLIYEN